MDERILNAHAGSPFSLPEHEARSRQLADCIPQIVWFARPDGVLCHVNRSWYEFTGFDRQQLERCGLQEAWTAILHPQDLQSIARAWREALNGCGTFEVEYRMFDRVTGEYRWYLGRATPVRDEHGAVLQWFGTSTDIHDQKSANEHLMVSQQRLQVALEAAQMATWELDLINDRIFRSEHHDRLYGIFENRPEWTFRSLLEQIHPEDRGNFERELHDCFLNGMDGFFAEYRVVWPDESVHWMSTRARIIRDQAGSPVLIRGAVMEVSRQKETEARLQQAMRIRDEFIGVASHELRTPITSLKLQLQMMNRLIERDHYERLDPVRLGKMVETSLRQIGTLAGLVNDLLDVSRIVNGKLLIEPEETNFAEVVREAVWQFQAQLEAAHCPVELILDENAQGFWDRKRIEQIVVNLVSNAAKYGAGHPVVIRLERLGEQVRLSVKDQGIGIPKEAQERIFNRFERAIDSRNISGLGLGLYIVSRILAAHGGSIRVFSEPGRGAEFIVELPLRTSPKSKWSAPRSA